MTGTENRIKLIKFRVTPKERALIDKAVAAQASTGGRKISSFTRNTVLDRAQKVVDERRRRRASRIRIHHGGEGGRK